MEVFDEHLYELEMRGPRERWFRETRDRRWKLPRGSWPGDSSFLCRIVWSDVSVLRRFIAKYVDPSCRSTWRSEGRSISSHFIREVLLPHVAAFIDDRKEAIRSDLSGMHEFYDARDLALALEHVETEVGDLKNELAIKCEIQAIKLAKREAQVHPIRQPKSPQRAGASLAVQTKRYRTPQAKNIDTLRKECGWSFEKLSEKTGIDKKLVLSHVNKSTKPSPRTLREYAQAFTKALDRRITAIDLEK